MSARRHVQSICLIYEASEEVEDADLVDPIKDVVLLCKVQVLNMKPNLSFLTNERVSIINFYLRINRT